MTNVQNPFPALRTPPVCCNLFLFQNKACSKIHAVVLLLQFLFVVFSVGAVITCLDTLVGPLCMYITSKTSTLTSAFLGLETPELHHFACELYATITF